ncbi:zinc finger matrin-type protein 3-like [Triticum urartu]|uniref:zinc finger matrin-type protein 3-like n=1 Tax=Triticum urartu TaxID=4572 RepID=UPI002043C598|nr:zinc finger matrin-type protein 3-like [Triticum urartu]
MDIRMNATPRSRLQIRAPTVVKAHNVDVARPCQAHSDQEEGYTAADITLENAIERQKLRIRARRASGGAVHQAPLPVQNPASLSSDAPAHRAGTKRQATWPPPGVSGVRQPPQNQFQALAPPRQQYQERQPQMQYVAAPPAQALTLQKQRSRPHATPAAARTPPPQMTTSSKPPLHLRSPANLAAGNTPSIVCRVCGVRCMTAFNLRQHEEGRKHRNKVANAAGEANVRCEMCDVVLSGKLNVQEHYAGKQHLHRVFSSGASATAGEINVRCEMCDVLISGELNVQEHYAGKHHLRRVFLSGASGTAGNPAT